MHNRFSGEARYKHECFSPLFFLKFAKFAVEQRNTSVERRSSLPLLFLFHSLFILAVSFSRRNQCKWPRFNTSPHLQFSRVSRVTRITKYASYSRVCTYTYSIYICVCACVCARARARACVCVCVCVYVCVCKCISRPADIHTAHLRTDETAGSHIPSFEMRACRFRRKYEENI